MVRVVLAVEWLPGEPARTIVWRWLAALQGAEIWGAAREVFVDRGDDRPEPISIARCRELLGDEADTLTDQDVELIRRHAETMAQVVVQMYMESRRIPG